VAACLKRNLSTRFLSYMYQLSVNPPFIASSFQTSSHMLINYSSSLPFDLCISAKLAMNSKEALSTFWLPWSFLVDSSVGFIQCWMRSKLSLSQWNTWEWCSEEALNNNEKLMERTKCYPNANRRIQLTRLSPCHPIKITWWFIWELTVVQFVTRYWLHRSTYKQNTCNLPNESTHDLNWAAIRIWTR